MSKKWLMWAGCGVMVIGGAYLLWARGAQNFRGYGMGHDHGGHGDGEASNSDRKPACH
jgi:hypothetical protein